MLTYAAFFLNQAYLKAPSIGAYQFATGDFTVEAWVRTATAGGSGTIVSRKLSSGGPGNGGFLLLIKPNGSIKLATDNGSGFAEADSVATAVNDATWHFVAAVRKGATITIYLDGLAIPSSVAQSAPPPLNVNSGAPLTIGTTDQTQEPFRFFSGQLGAVTIWSMARSAQDLVHDMTTTLSGSEPGLAGYWSFSGQNGADSSPNHNTAQPQGTITYVPPGPPQDGGDYAATLANRGFLSANNHAAYQFGVGDFTVEAWIKTAASGGSGTIVSRKDAQGGPGDGGFLLILKSNGAIKLATDSGTGFFEANTQPTSANDGQWHHVAAVRQGAAFQIYLDGALVPSTTGGTQPPPLSVNNALPLTIGTTQQTQEPFNFFTGSLDEVIVWRVARGAAQIPLDMRPTWTTPPPEVVGYWGFRYRNGLDLSLTANPAAPNGSVTYTSPGAPDEYYGAETANQSYLQAPSNNAYQFGTGDFTVEAWILAAQPGGSGTIVARKLTQGGQNEGGFLLVVRPDGSIKFATDSGFGFFQGVTGPTNANDGKWHFLAGVRQGTQFFLYVDAVLAPNAANGNASPPLNVNNPEPLTLAAALQTEEQFRFFTGQLDQVAVWNAARSQASIASDMITRLAGTEPNLVGLWNFDFRDGRDRSPTRNTAAAVGTVTFPPPGAPIGQAITAAPTFLSASYDGTTAAASWTAVQQPLVTGYRLVLFQGQSQVSEASGPATNGSIQKALTTPPYTLQVKATGANIEGPFSLPLVVIASAPGNVRVVTTTLIQASWDGISGVTSYRATLLKNGAPLNTQPVTSTQVGFPLPLDTSAAYAISVAGATPDQISIGPASQPVAVILLAPTITAVAFDGTTLTVDWTPVSEAGVTGYLVSVLDGAAEIAHATETGTHAAIPVALQNKSTYTVVVRATGTVTQGPNSPAVAILPVAPSGLYGGTDGTHVAAAWQALTGAASYQAEVSIGGVFQPAEPAGGPSIVFTTAAQANAMYQVRVRGIRGIVTGPWSAAAPGPFLADWTITYDGFGRVLTRVGAGLSSTTYTYDELGNITSVTVTTP